MMVRTHKLNKTSPIAIFILLILPFSLFPFLIPSAQFTTRISFYLCQHLHVHVPKLPFHPHTCTQCGGIAFGSSRYAVLALLLPTKAIGATYQRQSSPKTLNLNFFTAYCSILAEFVFYSSIHPLQTPTLVLASQWCINWIFISKKLILPSSRPSKDDYKVESIILKNWSKCILESMIKQSPSNCRRGKNDQKIAQGRERVCGCSEDYIQEQ